MRDPLKKPYCHEKDLGLPIPESNHATSVCMPRWKDIISYQEKKINTISKFKCGYPRFFLHPFVSQLFDFANKEFAKNSESAIVLPSISSAWRAAEFIKKNCSNAYCRIENLGWGKIAVLLIKKENFNLAWKYWQHSGEIISSRFANYILSESSPIKNNQLHNKESSDLIKLRISNLYGDIGKENVFLFSSGMSAISAIYRICTKNNDSKSLQIEFPYVDTLKLQNEVGNGVGDLTKIDNNGGVNEIKNWIKRNGNPSAVLTEIPSNPLLNTTDINEIYPILSNNNVPFIIDDTIATPVNVNVLECCDVIVTSLTKSFSGFGDVMGGAVIINPKSQFFSSYSNELKLEEENNFLFEEDAIILEKNSQNLRYRIDKSNKTSQLVVDYLVNNNKIEKVWYPSINTRKFYDKIKKTDGGYGSLISFTIKGSDSKSSNFYDNLELSKGPSLGTYFSLVCPYTLLAHYNELKWVNERSIPNNLIRLSIGIESDIDIIYKLEYALK